MKHQFPYKFRFNGYYWDLEEIEERLFNMFSYPHGKCYMDERYWYSGEADLRNKFIKYPPCTEFDPEAKKKFLAEMDELYEHYKDDPKWTRTEQNRKDDEDEVFLYEHSHIGVWEIVGFKKTGYDYGIQTFAFKNEVDLALFLLIHGEDLHKLIYNGEK